MRRSGHRHTHRNYNVSTWGEDSCPRERPQGKWALLSPGSQSPASGKGRGRISLLKLSALWCFANLDWADLCRMWTEAPRLWRENHWKSEYTPLKWSHPWAWGSDREHRGEGVCRNRTHSPPPPGRPQCVVSFASYGSREFEVIHQRGTNQPWCSHFDWHLTMEVNVSAHPEAWLEAPGSESADYPGGGGGRRDTDPRLFGEQGWQGYNDDPACHFNMWCGFQPHQRGGGEEGGIKKLWDTAPTCFHNTVSLIINAGSSLLHGL